jgi:acetyl esterase
VVLEPVTQQFVELMAAEPAMRTPSEAAAAALFARLQSAPVGKPSVRIADLTVPAGAAGPLRLRAIRPRDGDGALPVIMHFPGGGLAPGDPTTHDRLLRELAVGVGAAVICVARGGPPAAGYPAAVERAYAATRHVADNAAALNLDATRLAVFGDGVGGNVAAAMTLLAKQRRGPNIDFQVLVCPVTAARFDTESYALFADGPWLTRAAMERFWDAYLPDAARRDEIAASPLGASADQLHNLPDALVIVAENDVLRDEGESYARKLSDAGARVTSVRYNGTIHDFVVLNALADTPAARGAIAQAICALKAALG